MKSNIYMILYHTVQLVTTKLSTKFLKILSQVVPEKSLTENFNMHYIGVRDGKRKMKTEGNNKYKPHDFLLHDILGLQVYTKFEYLNFYRSSEICYRNFEW